MKEYLVRVALASLACATPAASWAEGEWTLQECLAYARQHNIQLQKSRITELSGQVSLKQYKAQLLPSLSFTTSQSVGYRPFQETMSVVHDGQVSSTSNKVTEQGAYGLNASWTVWNGNINRMNIQSQALQNQLNTFQTQQSELSIQEQIARLYVSILYTTEAKKVAEQLAETAQKQWERGQALLENGQMAQADVTALEAQYNSTKYDVVNSETQIANYKRQLKALLELDINTPFDVTGQEPTDAQVSADIPSATSVYEEALRTRPEIQAAYISIQAAELQEKIAKAGHLPTVMLQGSIGDNHYTGSNQKAGEQMKRNLNGSLGVTVSVPILDQRRTKSAVEQAVLKNTSTQLDLLDQKKALSSTVEEYWLNAVSNQQRYVAAKSMLKSQQESYEALNEQFNEGLKNIVELLQGRDNLLNAQQNLLQSKYNTLLYKQLLYFYRGESINL